MPATPISPAIPDSADGQTRQLFRILLDRVNYLTQEVERLQTRPAGEVSAVRQQVGQLSVAVQAVKDALTQQSTFVSFGSATPIDEFDPSTWPGSTNVSILGNVITGSWNASVIQPQFGGTGLSIQPGTSGIPYVNNGSWQLDTPEVATARLDVFTALAKGLVPNPGTVANKFLRDDGTWQTISVGAAGSTGQVQFNSSGQFAASSKLTFDDTAQALKLVRELRLYRTPTTPVYAGIRVADLLDENVMLTLPTDLGEYGQYLTTDGFGGLFWATYTPVAANTKPYAWFIS